MNETLHTPPFSRWAAEAGIVLILVGICMSGCSYYSSSYDYSFSPDGLTVAFPMSKKWDLPLPPELPTFYATVFVTWCQLNGTHVCQRVEIDSSGPKHNPFDEKAVSLRFSPDSRHLAVTTPHRLVVIECESRKMRQLSRSAERVSAFGWLGNDEIGYIVHTTREKKHGKRTDRTFIRQKISSQPEDRKEFYRETNLRHAPPESWSPDGRFVIFHQSDRKSMQLMNTAQRTVTVFGPSKSSYSSVSWKSDGSAAFCAFSGYKQPIHVLVIYLPSGEIVDVTRQFTDAFVTDPFYSLPSVLPLWTADGEYIIVNDYRGMGGCLVRPHPWQVIPLTKKLVQHLGRTDHTWPHNNIVRFPTPDWVGVWVDGQTYAVDYEAKIAVPIGSTRNWLPGWILTPDGKSSFAVERDGKFLIHAVELSTPR